MSSRRQRGRLDEVVAVLRERRRERWRDPASVGMATRLAPVLSGLKQAARDPTDGSGTG
jgi:hypothetical protein